MARRMYPIRKMVNFATHETRRIIRREINYYRVKPTHALLFMTYRCTSRCKMCTIWQRGTQARVGDELILDEWQSVLDMLRDMGVSIIEFFGGDALLRKDILIPLIKYAHDKGFYTELPTNCNLLDRDMAIPLVESGLDNVWISLDAIGRTHDEVRGREGTFQRVDRAIKELRNARGKNNTPNILINCVVSKVNLNNFEEIIPYALETGISAIDFEYLGEIPPKSISKSALDGLIPTPFFTSLGSSVLLDKREAILLKNKLRKIRHNRIRNGLRVNTQKIDILSVKELVSGKFPNKRCYICRDIVTIDPYGNVMGCLHFNNYHLGNIRNEDLTSTWRNKKHMYFMERQRSNKIGICKYCSNGLLRNYTPIQSLQSLYFEVTKKGRN